MPPLLQVDSQGISAFGETTAERLWRIQTNAGLTDEIQIAGSASGVPCRITGLALPVSNADAVTKSYVDSLMSNLRLKSPARVVASTNMLLSELIADVTIDDVILGAGDRILLKAQTNPVENGIWIVPAAGNLPARPQDYATGSQASGAYVFIDQGTVWKDRSFACITDRGVDVVDTNETEWIQFSSRSSALAGYGLLAGATNELTINGSIVPELGVNNTFTGATNTFSGALNVSGVLTGSSSISVPRITNLNTGSITAPGDAINLQYLSDRFNTFNFKAPVSVATTEAIVDLDTTGLVIGTMVDGVAVAAGDRVLVKDQANAVENGIYVVADIADTAPVRSVDMAAGSSANGAFVVATRGTVFGDQAFICINDSLASSIVGTAQLQFTALVTQATGLAGAGLVENGRALDVNPDNSTLEVVNDQVRVRAEGITNTQIAPATIQNSRLVNEAVTLVTTTGDGLTSTNGGVVSLGSTVGLAVDHTYIPYLNRTNTFQMENTFSTHVSMNGNLTVATGGIVSAPQLTGLDTTLVSQDSDAVTVQYVREQVTNKLVSKLPVRVASTTSETLSTLLADSVVDGVTLQVGDRVLLAGQASAIENGIYIVSAAEAPTRSPDMSIGIPNVAGSTVVVKEGALYADRMFVCTSELDTIGTDPLNFTVIGQSLAQLAGHALAANETAMRLDVTTDNSTLEVASDALQIKDAGVTNAKIADATIQNQKLVNDSVTVNAVTGLLRTVLDSQGQPSTNPADLELGGTVSLEVDHTHIPYLSRANTFTNTNDFSQRVRLTANVAASTDGGTPDATLVVTGGVYVSGDLYATSTLNYSDVRLKRNIAPIDNALEIISNIRGCTYDWNDEEINGDRRGAPAVGVIAQELQEAGAGIAVTQNGEWLAVDYVRLVPFLVESVKTLKRTCDELGEEVRELKRSRVSP